jgi:CHAT domain-containing protein
MLLCGLALAGANLPPDARGEAPGILTAEEIALMDLPNCELAVLSACETSLGRRQRAGQGLASLQQALHAAGVRTAITSLWSVPDEATRELMTDFYRRIWLDRTPKAQALWEAKCTLRQAKSADGSPRFQVRDWAAWVLSGDPD